MDVVFRTDASSAIGAGHLARCLALADALRGHGARCRFVCRDLADAYAERVLASGHELTQLDASGGAGAEAQNSDAAHTVTALAGRHADWLVVDHYGLDAMWERALRPVARRILAIDDLANRAHECDALLDQNFYDNAQRRYVGLVPAHCALALGPEFSLLRREFYDARRTLRVRDGSIRRVLVALGGADEVNVTGKALDALCRPELGALHIDVLVGGLNRRRRELEAQYGRHTSVHWHENTSNVAALMSAADLSIGAGGTMNWERCCLGLPAVVVVIATNQAETNEALSRAGIILNLGWHEAVDAAAIGVAVRQLAADPALVHRLSRAAMALMSHDGTADEPKIVKLLMESRA